VTQPNFIQMAPGEGPVYSLVGDVYVYKITGAETDGAYALFEARVEPGGGPPPHIHHREDEDFFVLEGELTFYVDGREIVAPAGTYVHAPKNQAHRFRNNSKQTARTLIWVHPAGIEKFFAEVGTRLPDSSAPAVPILPEHIEKLLAAAPKYGLDILPPPH
jgi:quercetin dioxygenase-like cupin family protein